MGCDIHAFIEYKKPDYNNWSGFGGRINPGRTYGVFAHLAGVRNYNNYSPIAADRGVPDDISYSAFDSYSRYICDESNTEGYVRAEQAAKWVEQGYSRYLRENKSFISGPDWHSGSWCTADELHTAIERTWEDGYNGYESEWLVVYDAMKSFEKRGYESRLVFWFDN